MAVLLQLHNISRGGARNQAESDNYAATVCRGNRRREHTGKDAECEGEQEKEMIARAKSNDDLHGGGGLVRASPAGSKKKKKEEVWLD